MPAPHKEPEWVQPFLAALGVCGNVTRAAGLAGVDVSGPYNRRNRYPAFREAWLRVMAEREARACGGGEGVETSQEKTLPSADIPSTQERRRSLEVGSAPLACGESPSPSRGEGLVGRAGDGVKLSRVAGGRWSKGTETRFLEELTACANVARAAAAVGFSAASAYKKRLRDPHFAQGWEAAMAVGRARLEAHLLDAADRALDPDALPIAEGAPKVTVGEAISILKHNPSGSGPGKLGPGGGRGRRRDGYMDWVTDEDVDIMEQAEAARASIFDKLARMIEQDNERKRAAGWTLHGEDWIPPGWSLTSGGGSG